MNTIWIADVIFICLLLLIAWPLGHYIYAVLEGHPTFLSRLIHPAEHFILRIIKQDNKQEMTAREYAESVISFSLISLAAVFLIQVFQEYLPFNPQHLSSVDWDLAFNTAVSFVTNTNWQAYSGETTMTYFTQMTALTVQNFLSAAAGIAVLFTLIRGFTRKTTGLIGNFWLDMVRIILYILLPLSFSLAIVLISQGVVQSFAEYQQITTLESGITQLISLGPAASQIAIKQLGTNGGGFFGLNSAYPLENPTSLSNFMQLLSILLIPTALCFSFGKAVNNRKQGYVILAVMLSLFIFAVLIVTINEFKGIPEYLGVLYTGNMEGKEVINGIGTSSLWGVATTAASNGSVNAMLDSFTPLGGMILIFLMQLGEIVFGGVGSGLYGMLAFVILTVFIAGLMVGRTPEYLGKKIEPFDMRMVCLIILIPPMLSLLTTATATLLPQVTDWLTNDGAHGFSEILYAFTSMSNNNGSAFAGYAADNLFTNLVGGLTMLFARFIPMVAVIFLAGNLAKKKSIPFGSGTMSTSNLMFFFLLLAIILIIGALSFLPSLALGPLAEYMQYLRQV